MYHSASIRTLYFIAFIWTAISAPVQTHAEVWGTPGIIRLDSLTGLKFSGNPSYHIGNSAAEIPDERNFIPFHSSDDKAMIWKKTATHPFWIRVVVENPHPNEVKSVLRIFYYGNELKAFIENNGVLIDQQLPVNSEKSDYFYSGGDIVFKPGKNVLYVHLKRAWSKASFGFDIVNIEDVADDRLDYFSNYTGTLIGMAAFLFLIAFQILYVSIQHYYHRKQEYLEYFFYLLCIGIYFFVRFDLSMRFSIISSVNIYLPPLLNDIMLILPYTFYLRFSRYYIGMKENYPKQNQQIKTVEWINVMFIVPMLILQFMGLGYIAIPLVTVFILILFVYTLWLVRFFYLRRDPLIWFLLAGSVCAASGHATAMCLNFFPGLIDTYNLHPLYFTMTGLIFEIFFFNTGLGYKAKFEQQEKIKAQLKIIEQLDRNQKMQLQLEGMRDKIAIDLHDDVGSTLSSIGVYSQVAMSSIDTDATKTKNILQKISDSTQRMMNSMSDIVWAIHSKNDKGEGLVNKIRNSAQERLDQTGIRITINSSLELNQMHFTMDARRNIVLLFKEAINNAAKYSKATHVGCEMVIENNFFTMTIHDNGIGFNQETTNKGNGMSSMPARAKELNGELTITSSPGKGTAIIFKVHLNQITFSAINALT